MQFFRVTWSLASGWEVGGRRETLSFNITSQMLSPRLALLALTREVLTGSRNTYKSV